MQGAYVNLTADSALLQSAQPHLEELLSSLPRTPQSGAADSAPWDTLLPRANEALLVPTQVCPVSFCNSS